MRDNNTGWDISWQCDSPSPAWRWGAWPAWPDAAQWGIPAGRPLLLTAKGRVRCPVCKQTTLQFHCDNKRPSLQYLFQDCSAVKDKTLSAPSLRPGPFVLLFRKLCALSSWLSTSALTISAHLPNHKYVKQSVFRARPVSEENIRASALCNHCEQ